jgi:hypothetical protein
MKGSGMAGMLTQMKMQKRLKPGKTKGGSGGNFIAGAIKRPGALTAAVGGKPSQNMGKVDQLAQSGTTQQKREANFYKNVLKPASAGRKRKKAFRGAFKKAQKQLGMNTDKQVSYPDSD